MSAYLCDPHHVALLAVMAARQPYGKPGTENENAATLALANLASLDVRYGPSPVEREPRAYVADCVKACRDWRWSPKPSPVEIIKAVQCFDYQACEVADYEDTPAAKITRRVKSDAIASLPGYEEAPWGAPEPKPGNVVVLA